MGITPRAIVRLKDRLIQHATSETWHDIGLVTANSEMIQEHPRLLRSLSWSDEDYNGNVASVLSAIIAADERNFQIIADYLEDRFPDQDGYVSNRPSTRKILFAPSVFNIPDESQDERLISVMMPFERSFDDVYSAIREACAESSYSCIRADDVWNESVIVQDVFNLIFRSHAVIVDFSGKNSNVMYETGIAHTLGKLVIPITRSVDDVPFDLRHHRFLNYLPNSEGLSTLRQKLTDKLTRI